MTIVRCLTDEPLLLGRDPLILERLGDYRVRGGYAPADPHRLLQRIDAAGLRGRGGAAFPLAAKVRAVVASAAATGLRPVVVANGEEGEPGSVKDRHLMRARPHLVLDGLAHAAALVGAERAYAYVSDPVSAGTLRDALAACPPAAPTTVVEVDRTYVAGEETAAHRTPAQPDPPPAQPGQPPTQPDRPRARPDRTPAWLGRRPAGLGGRPWTRLDGGPRRCRGAGPVGSWTPQPGSPDRCCRTCLPVRSPRGAR